jgi:hypothetical protein
VRDEFKPEVNFRPSAAPSRSSPARRCASRTRLSALHQVAGKRLCEPSQKGGVFVCLHAHHATVLASVIVTVLGLRPVPSCDPSQKGWLWERPQAHHQYSPGSTFCTMGLRWQIRGSAISVFLFLLGRVHVGGHFQAQRVQPNKAGGVVLIIGFCGIGFHRRKVWIVKAHGRFPACGDDVAFI